MPKRPVSVLVMTDDKNTRRGLMDLFADARFRASCSNDVLAMQTLLNCRHFDLLILDAKLRCRECCALCHLVRTISNLVIVLVVESHDDPVILVGLNAGADAYVLRNDRPIDMLARLQCVLRRAMGTLIVPVDMQPMRFAGWRVDPRNRLLLDPKGTTVSLTAAEFDLLVALARNAGTVVSRKQLLASTFFGVARPVERSIDVHIARLRAKIETDPRAPALIKTVRLGGYLLAVPVDPEQ
ncbi:Aerobic respiration control protein ArcA [Ensifer adhaerens]|uniref:response regulator transcription factor n=1 Tax=Ensifer adhaerens TaxID=106592 RepID=UPI001568EC4D|nr:response regulator transcription factor [Ensifer adhaerens]NRP21818.1 Aerobic respiration control protein ArcA [Ensifer adhaerens]